MSIKISAVCAHCKEQSSEPSLEFDFAEQTFYYVCPKCLKSNKIVLKVENKPFPKPKRMR